MSLSDPTVVAQQYASEDGLLARRSIYQHDDGPDARAATFAAIAALRPARVLEVGCGPGELAARMSSELDANVVALDISPRMVELAWARGVDARLGDVQELPFEDESFDVAIAAWMLFHAPDLDRAIDELHRVLRPGGRLVAVTNSERHLEEVRALGQVSVPLSFSRESGERILRRRFGAVSREDLDGCVTFPDVEAVRAYLRSSVSMQAGADRVPDLEGVILATRRCTIFVAARE